MYPEHLDRCLVIDIEAVPPRGTQSAQMFKLGAFRPDTGKKLEDWTDSQTLFERLESIAEGADFVLGHNVIAHDIPILHEKWAHLSLLRLPIIDTLQLSPLAFPNNPYHRLLKDYKLLRETLNSPLQDCLSTWKLFQDQINAFSFLEKTHPQEFLCYQALIASEHASGLGRFFSGLTKRPSMARENMAQWLPEVLRENDPTLTRSSKVCSQRLERLTRVDANQPDMAWPISYALAWLRVSGGNSVLPPWVRHQYPQVSQLIHELRDTPCGDPGCGYCRTTHDPRHELKRYFEFDDFRYEKPGESAQFNIVLAGMRSQSVLAVLATGGGKSICYQLPALNRYHRNGSLTIIVSPLQSLMKDQVDGLMARNVQCAAALNGLLTMPERADVLEKIQMGDIGVLLVSPEQFRNVSFGKAIAQRHIGAWIFDEAHCLSKWGNDFRPDYLYVARFIKEKYPPGAIAPIGCFTATAKQDVLDDIRDHFKHELNIVFQDFIGTPERKNLNFEIYPVEKNEKHSRTHLLMTDAIEGTTGGAVVFVSSRKRAEFLAEFLAEQGWRCKHFHAGLMPNEKKDVQEAFIRGDLQAIVATNAFGMGVDKPDVRLVVHADIPGSLENYLQEAGRAGRDQAFARCVLLYCPEDIENQFGQSERSQLSQRDIQQILKKLRQEAKKRPKADLVITAGEILNDEMMQTSFSVDDRDADTKVGTALAWLERGEFLRRTENRTQIFPARVRMSAQDATDRLEQAQLSARRKAEFQTILNSIYRAKADERISTDQLMQLTGLSSEEVGMCLKQLEVLGLLENDTLLTLYLRSGVKDASIVRLTQSLQLETALLDELRQQAPEADQGGWMDLNLPPFTHQLRSTCANESLLPLHVLRLLKSIAQDRDGESQQRSSMELKQVTRDHLKIRIREQKTWSQIQRQGEKRRKIAQAFLPYLLNKLSPGIQGKDLLVQTTMGELKACISGDLELNAIIPLEQRQQAIEHVLLFLHQQEIIQLNHGMTVMRRAMTISINPEKNTQRYLKEDYQRLEDHYNERRNQVHFIREYAETGLHEMKKAMSLVVDYFTLHKHDFISRYFRGKTQLLKLATSEASWKKITQGLNPQQHKIVTDDTDKNRLILAGPGSGKTRVVVHRIAYLLRVRRIPATAIIALTFNRHAAIEIRQRLFELIGNDAIGITVMTYHAMAMRLTGTSFDRKDAVQEHDLEALLDRAAELLEGKALNTEDGEDDLREHLLQGYRYILVDEYQDIDARQYRLVSALSRRQGNADDKDADLCILAVGDDDQNIYAFRGGSNAHIQRFQDEFSADTSYLVENYRSSQAIVHASNALIEQNTQRLKSAHPIRVDSQRETQPAGGRWHGLDPRYQGAVLRLIVSEADRWHGNLQAQAAVQELVRLRKLSNQSSWDGCAILARSHRYLVPVQAWCEQNEVAYFLASNKERSLPLTRQRAFLTVLEHIRRHPVESLTASALKDSLPSLALSAHWHRQFDMALDQLHGEFGDCQLSSGTVIDWLYEFAREIRQQPKPGLFLGTVHAAKGLEFQKVVLLDGDWLSQAKDAQESRRLYYVGMTRAKEALALCEFSAGGSHSSTLHAQTVCVAHQGTYLSTLEARYSPLSLQHIDLGFAGRHPANAPVHQALAKLQPGDPLGFRLDGGIWYLSAENGTIVGKTAKSFSLDFIPQHCEVLDLTTRYATDSSAPFIQQMKVPQWEVVVPRFFSDAPSSTPRPRNPGR